VDPGPDVPQFDGDFVELLLGAGHPAGGIVHGGEAAVAGEPPVAVGQSPGVGGFRLGGRPGRGVGCVSGR